MFVYESVAETNQRLNGALFLYNKEPVLCRGAYLDDHNNIMMKITFCPRYVEEAEIPVTDSLIETKCLPQGYINTQQGASYMSRLPAVGHYKQGYDLANVQFSVYDPDDRYACALDWATALRTAGLRDMFQNKYPSVKEAVERLVNSKDDVPVSVAFHRMFALRRDKRRKDFLLDYKGEWVAFGSDENFQLPSEFHYMRDQLARNGIKVA